jgi:hypothetical protein
MAIPKISQHNFLIPIPTPLFLYPFSPLTHLFHPSYLPSLSSRHILHLLSSPSVQYLVHSLPRYTGTSSVMHLASLILPVVPAFSPFSPACPCLCPSRSAPRSSIFFPLSFFPLPHWHTRSCCSTSLSLSHLRSFSFPHSTHTVSCTLLFRRFCLRTLLSLSACSSCTLPSLCTPVFLCPLLAPISIFSLALSPPPPVPSIPRSLFRTSARSLPCSRTSSFSS